MCRGLFFLCLVRSVFYMFRDKIGPLVFLVLVFNISSSVVQ